MSFPFEKPSDHSGASFFPVKDHLNDVALMVEPKSVQLDVPNTYQGRTTTRDEVRCDVTVFANASSLDQGLPTKIYKDTVIHNTALASTLKKVMGKVMTARLAKKQMSGGSGYVFEDLTDDENNKLASYWQKRSDTAASAPSFDD